MALCRDPEWNQDSVAIGRTHFPRSGPDPNPTLLILGLFSFPEFAWPLPIPLLPCQGLSVLSQSSDPRGFPLCPQRMSEAHGQNFQAQALCFSVPCLSQGLGSACVGFSPDTPRGDQAK